MCQCVPIPLPFDLMHGPCAPAIVSGGMCTYYLNYLHALGIDPLIRKNQLFLLHLITSYSSYFEGKKGISGNKTSFFLLMASLPFLPPLCECMQSLSVSYPFTFAQSSLYCLGSIKCVMCMSIQVVCTPKPPPCMPCKLKPHEPPSPVIPLLVLHTATVLVLWHLELVTFRKQT